MPHVVRFDCFEVDLSAGQLLKRGIRIGLRDQSFQILASLLEHPGQVVSREELRRRLWRDQVFVDFDNNLNAAIARLREALGDSAEHPHFIETLPKRGYRFLGAVSETFPVEPVPARRAKLVVLPFVNLNGDPAQEYFSDAMTDEIITELAALCPEHLAVIARTTTMHYKSCQKDVAQIGRELNVDYALEGGVRRWDDNLSINVQLVQTSDQTHLFARKYEARLRDIFNTQACIAQAIASSIPSTSGKLNIAEPGVGRRRRKPTEDPVAYNLYLQGRYQMRQAIPASLAAAKEYFERALARDPQFALAYYALAEMHWWTGFQGFVRPKDAFSTGVFAALRAIEVDPSLAQAHALLGSYRKELDYNWPEVHREMRFALELDPSSPEALFCYAGSYLMAQGRLQESLETLQGALELDPLSQLVRWGLTLDLYLARLYERALEQVEISIGIDPSYFFSYFWAGLVRCEQGNFDEAIAALRTGVQLSGGAPLVRGALGMTLGRSGRTDDARKVLSELHAMASQMYVLPSSFAWIHIGLGEVDQAFTWMERAIDDRDPIIVPIKTYPFLDPLRGDLRFHALLRKMNLDP